MNLKKFAIGLNILLMFLFIGYFIGHGLPQSLILWVSAILWFVAPIVNLFYILMNKKTRQTINKSTQPENSENRKATLTPCLHSLQLKKPTFLCIVLLQISFAPLSYQVVFANNHEYVSFAYLPFYYYHLLSPFYLLILIMNSLIYYLLVWIASFFFPGIIYFVLQLFRKLS